MTHWRGLGILFFCMLVSSWASPRVVFGDTRTLTSYFPAPFGAYQKLRLYPQDRAVSLGDPCAPAGTLYFESDILGTQEVRFCQDSSDNGIADGKWSLLSSVWTQAFENGIYYTYPAVSADMDWSKPEDLSIGLGITTPQGRGLHVHNSDHNFKVDWSTVGSSGPTLIISAQDPNWALIGLNDTTGMGYVRLTEVSTAGALHDAWFFATHTTYDPAVTNPLYGPGVFMIAHETYTNLQGSNYWGTPAYGKLTIAPDGNVGLGADEARLPKARVHLVNSDGATAVRLEEESEKPNKKIWEIRAVDGTNAVTDPDRLSIRGGQVLNGDQDIERLVIDNSGRVGIGVRAPRAMLELQQDADIILEGPDPAVIFKDTGGAADTNPDFIIHLDNDALYLDIKDDEGTVHALTMEGEVFDPNSRTGTVAYPDSLPPDPAPKYTAKFGISEQSTAVGAPAPTDLTAPLTVMGDGEMIIEDEDVEIDWRGNPPGSTKPGYHWRMTLDHTGLRLNAQSADTLAWANNLMVINPETGNIGFGRDPDSDKALHFANGAYLSTSGCWVDGSSRDYKDDIRSLDLASTLSVFHELRPVLFEYKSLPETPRAGFIAEDVPDAVATSDRKAISPTPIISVLTRVVQYQQELNGQLDQTITEQRERLEILRSRLDAR